jgi:hypothetical protein
MRGYGAQETIDIYDYQSNEMGEWREKNSV